MQPNSNMHEESGQNCHHVMQPNSNMHEESGHNCHRVAYKPLMHVKKTVTSAMWAYEWARLVKKVLSIAKVTNGNPLWGEQAKWGRFRFIWRLAFFPELSYKRFKDHPIHITFSAFPVNRHIKSLNCLSFIWLFRGFSLIRHIRSLRWCRFIWLLAKNREIVI